MNIILCTCPEKFAESLIRKLLEERLIACANTIYGVTSQYWWQGQIETDKEALLIMKTSSAVLERALERIKQLHTYEVPEIIAFEADKVNPDYLKWVTETTTGKVVPE